jgi:hypothetical protein
MFGWLGTWYGKPMPIAVESRLEFPVGMDLDQEKLLRWFALLQITWWLSCCYSRFSNPAAVMDWISSHSEDTRLDHENIRHLDATFMDCS